MAIEVVYNPVAEMADAAFFGSQGVAAEDSRRRNQALALQDRELDYRTQLALLGQQLDRRALDQRGWLGQQELGLRYGALQNQFFTDQQQLAQQDAYRQAALEQESAQTEAMLQRSAMSDLAAQARQQQTQRFQQALSSQEAIRKEWRSLNPRQQQQVVAQWEQDWGMPWSGPEQAMAQMEQQDQEARISNLHTNFFTAPDGTALIDPGGVQAMLDAGMEIKDIVAQGLKEKAEWRQRQAMQQKAEQEAAKAEKVWSDVEADNALNQQKFEQTAKQNELELQFQQQKAAQEMRLAKQKAMLDARLAFLKAQQAHAEASLATNEDGTSAAGPAPKWEDFDPSAAFAEDEPQQQAGPRRISSKAEYDALPPGSQYIAPDGTLRTKGA